MRARQTHSKAFSTTFSSISLQKILQSVTMSQTTVLKVAMSCQGCAGAVRRVLEKLEGVETFDIDVGAKKVTVVGNVDRDVVFQTVSKSGKKTAYWEDEVPAAPAPEAVPAAPALEAVSEAPVSEAVLAAPVSEAVLAAPVSEAAPAAPAPALETGRAVPEPEAVPAAAPPAEAEAKPAETVAVA